MVADSSTVAPPARVALSNQSQPLPFRWVRAAGSAPSHLGALVTSTFTFLRIGFSTPAIPSACRSSCDLLFYVKCTGVRQSFPALTISD
jgi:hypothetical protein